MKTILNAETQQSWRLAAGKPILKEYEGTSQGVFGFCTSSGLFFDHCWVQSVNTIVDITLDQFGEGKVLITSVRDRRYHKNLAEEDLHSEIIKLSHRSDKWLQEWNEQHRSL